MTIRTLQNADLAQITQAFNEAFADYFVPFKVTAEYLANRWKGARVDYGLSVGAFEGEVLTGFMIFGIDKLNGRLTAHNAGTGVIPAYRGRRLVEKMYDFIIPIFRENGIRQSTLEVITMNDKAIRAYVNSGYKIDRKLLCFSGEIRVEINSNGSYQVIKQKEIPWQLLSDLPKYQYSWELSEEGIRAISRDYECWMLQIEGKLKAYAIVNPDTGFIAQYSFESGQIENYGSDLFAVIGQSFQSVRINNVDENERELADFFQKIGLENHISQYEMRMKF